MQTDPLQVPLAIIGMACRLPGAENLDAFWRLLREGRCAISALPPDRLDQNLYYCAEKGVPGTTYARLGGVVPDPGLAAEPEDFDVSHRILLDVTSEACRHAGWNPGAVPTPNTGVYIGHARTSPRSGEIVCSAHIEEIAGYLDLVPSFKSLPDETRRRVADRIVESVHESKGRLGCGGKPFLGPGMAAVLVAESLGLTGPRMVIDAACASSLVALTLAAGALSQGQIEAAIVGGASFSSWQSLVLFGRAQALSDTGSFPFDERADGFISSDGYAALIVKTLSRAQSDGDSIHGVIRGIGLSSDGRGKSLWAPRKEGQIEAIRRAYTAKADASKLQYIEAHGTSTQLGDATELQSLATVFAGSLPPGARIPVASVKSNIGHTCETAGLAGVIKTLLAMKHRTIPPAANFEKANSRIDWEKHPFFVPQGALAWPAPQDGQPRRAAVDTFGIGGLNVHVVLEEALPGENRVAETVVPREPIAIIGTGAIFPGARTAAALRNLVASGRDVKSAAPVDRWDSELYCPGRSPTSLGGFITDFAYDWNKHRIPPKQVSAADPLQFMLLDAADQAFESAGCTGDRFDRKRTAVVVGTMFSGDFTRQLVVALQYPEVQAELERLLCEEGLPQDRVKAIVDGARKEFHKRKPMLADETGSYSSSTLASRIARTMDLMGGAFALDAEEASSLAAVDAAVGLLRTGACDMVLCAGAQRSMDITVYEEYNLRGLLSEADGFVPAEGAGVVLLKRLSDAERDGNPVLAVIRASGAERTESGKPMLDPIARQMGYALGASGMASLLAEVGKPQTGPVDITATTPRGLRYRIEMEKPADRAKPQPRVAFLFPGQGSQYAGMVRELVRQSPAAAAKLREIDSTMARLGYPSFAEIAWKEDAGLGTNVWLTQVSLLLADTIMFEALQEQGVQPDVVAGHSFGEYPALVAAGAWTLEHAIRATRVRCEQIEASSGAGGVLLATNAPVEVVERAAGGQGCHVAIRNAPDQTIAGGERSAVERLQKELAALGLDSQFVPAPGPFHTPLLADVRKPLANALADIEIRPPSVPVLSSVTNRYVADPIDIRQNLSVQLSTPLDYVQMVRRLAADGISVFVEVGPKQVLTRLNRRVLGSDPRLTILACDDARHPGVERLRLVKAELQKCGVALPASVAAVQTEAPVVVQHEILRFDATERRRKKNRETSARTAEAEVPQLAADELSACIVGLVCERTGYPPEVVDIDADLEADLGLDSIAKAQLFLELADRFELGNVREQRLQDFTTIRHLLDFISAHGKRKEPVAADAPPETLQILRLEGTPYEMGLEHARQHSAEINAIIDRYNQLLGGNAGEREDLRVAMANIEHYFGHSGVEELRGLADGCGLPLPFVAGYNLALVPDFLPGCSHFTSAAAGLVHGTNEDAPISLRLNQRFVPVAMVRHPAHGIPHLSFGLPGQLGGINGVNAFGLVVSSTSLLDQAAPAITSPGRSHSALVKEVLEGAEDIDAAIEIVRNARRSGAFSLLLSHHASGRVVYIEYSGDTIAVREQRERLAGANHSQMLPAANGLPSHSIHRLSRLDALLAMHGEACTLEQAKAALRDRYDQARGREVAHPTMNTVRRLDNLMSVIFRPAHGEAWVALGHKDREYERLNLRDLLDASVMRRWVLRTVEADLPGHGVPRLSGRVLVLGGNAAAVALASRLRELRCDVVELPAGCDIDCAVAAVERCWQDGPAPHLFLMTGRDAASRCVMLPYRVCQRWIQLMDEAGLGGEGTLVAATSLGGDFGLSGRIANAEGGGLAGLLKAVRREFPGLQIKIVDAPMEEQPERLAQSILSELAHRTREAEVAYRNGKRSVMRMVRRPAARRNPVSITAGGAWVVSGGARGITWFLARELGRRFGMKLHILGRSRSADLGYPATYHSCDVSDEVALAGVLAKIRKADGPIRGILHGAGVEAAARFERKNLDSVHATIGAKVNGAAHLMELTKDDPLEVFIASGSISGRFGGHGQTDYSLASDMLAKLVQGFRRERPECAAVTFHWPAWAEVGMATRPKSREALEVAGQRFMPPEEGLKHLLAELDAGVPEGEVLIIDGPGNLDLDGAMRPDVLPVTGLALVDGLVDANVAEIRFDPAGDDFLRDHRYNGAALLPAAAMAEILVEGALSASGDRQPAALENLEIRNALSFAAGRSQWARVEATRNARGYECRLVTEFRDRSGKLIDANRAIARAQVVFGAQGAAPLTANPESEQWHAMQYPDDGPLVHGPSMRVVREIALNAQGGYGRITAPAEQRSESTFPIAVLDGCLVVCGAFGVKVLGVYSLPGRFGSLKAWRAPRPDEACMVHVQFRGRVERTLRFDFTLAGEDGTTLIAAEGYQATVIGEEARA